MADLRALLAAREPLYAQAALTIETTGLSVEWVSAGVETAIAR